MNGIAPAAATEVFKNERRELSSGNMLRTACLCEVTIAVTSMSHRELHLQKARTTGPPLLLRRDCIRIYCDVTM